MTYTEAAYAMRYMPAEVHIDVYSAAESAESEWHNASPAAISVAKAASIEVALIFGGALSVIHPVRNLSERARKRAGVSHLSADKGRFRPQEQH